MAGFGVSGLGWFWDFGFRVQGLVAAGHRLSLGAFRTGSGGFWVVKWADVCSHRFKGASRIHTDLRFSIVVYLLLGFTTLGLKPCKVTHKELQWRP